MVILYKTDRKNDLYMRLALLDNRLLVTLLMLSRRVSFVGVKYVLKIGRRSKPASLFGDKNEMSQFSYWGKIASKLWPLFTGIFIKIVMPFFSHLDHFYLLPLPGLHSLKYLVWIFYVLPLWSVPILIWINPNLMTTPPPHIVWLLVTLFCCTLGPTKLKIKMPFLGGLLSLPSHLGKSWRQIHSSRSIFVDFTW